MQTTKLILLLVNGVLTGTAVIFGFIGFELREIKVSAIEKFFLDSVLFKHKSERNLGIFDDNFGREPETSLQPQYPKQEEVLGSNLWDSATDPEQPRQSNQQRLKQEFDRSE